MTAERILLGLMARIARKLRAAIGATLIGAMIIGASVPAGTWQGMSDWVFYRILNSPSLSIYFGSSDPHAFGTVFNVGVNIPFGYLLDSTDLFVVQVDMQGLLNMTRQVGPAGKSGFTRKC